MLCLSDGDPPELQKSIEQLEFLVGKEVLATVSLGTLSATHVVTGTALELPMLLGKQRGPTSSAHIHIRRKSGYNPATFWSKTLDIMCFQRASSVMYKHAISAVTDAEPACHSKTLLNPRGCVHLLRAQKQA